MAVKRRSPRSIFSYTAFKYRTVKMYLVPTVSSCGLCSAKTATPTQSDQKVGRANVIVLFVVKELTR